MCSVCEKFDDPDLHTTLWNVNIRNPIEKILMLLREQVEENDQMNTVKKLAI